MYQIQHREKIKININIKKIREEDKKMKVFKKLISIFLVVAMVTTVVMSISTFAETEIYSDNFDSYADIAAALAGGNWTTTLSGSAAISNGEVVLPADSGQGVRYNLPEKYTQGLFKVEADVKTYSGAQLLFELMPEGVAKGMCAVTGPGWNADRTVNNMFVQKTDYQSGYHLYTGEFNTWYHITVTLDIVAGKYNVKVENAEKTEVLAERKGLDTIVGDGVLTNLCAIQFRNWGSGYVYVDNFRIQKIGNGLVSPNIQTGISDNFDEYEDLVDAVNFGNWTTSSSTGSAAISNGEVVLPADNGQGVRYNLPEKYTQGLFKVEADVKTYSGAQLLFELMPEGAAKGMCAVTGPGWNADRTVNNMFVQKTDYQSGFHLYTGEFNTWYHITVTLDIVAGKYNVKVENAEKTEVLAERKGLDTIVGDGVLTNLCAIQFRNWGTGAVYVDNFRIQKIDAYNFNEYEAISEVITSPWSATYAGLKETTIVESNNGKAISFPANDENHGIQYNLPSIFSSGEMVVNFSVKSNNAKGGALITFPCGTWNELGLVGLHMYNGSFITYCTGYQAASKNLGNFSGNEWYDVSVSLNMTDKLYSIQIKHGGEVVAALNNLDLIKYNTIGELMERIACIRFVDWGKGIGGAGYEMDNFSVSYVENETKREFVITEASFDSADSLSGTKYWTADSGVVVTDGKLSLPAGTSAQKTVTLTENGKIKLEYTLNANGGKAEVNAISPGGSFVLASLDGTTEDINVTNIIDLDNCKLTYSVNGEEGTTVNIADKTSGKSLYNISAIQFANIGETDITVDNLVASIYVAKPENSNIAVKVTDAFGNIVAEGENVIPGVRTIEIDFGTDIESTSVEKAITFTSNGGDIPEFSLSTRKGKSTLEFDKVLNPDDTYILTISTDLKNTYGVALEEPFSYSFKTDTADVLAEIATLMVGDKEIYSITQLKKGDTLKLNANVVNSTESAVDAEFLIGYFAGGILKDVHTEKINIANGVMSIVDAEIVVGDLTGIEEIKVFLWDSVSGTMPYCKAVVCEDYLTNFTIYGSGANTHTQGICTDDKNSYLYQTSTTALKKYDIKTGELVASVSGFPQTMHLGDLIYNPEDGLIYCSTLLGSSKTAYIAIIDPEKLTSLDMDRNTEGLIKIAYVPAPESKYEWVYSVDAAAIAPLAGELRNSKKYLYVNRENPTYAAAHYSTFNVYDLDTLKSNAILYSDDNISCSENGTLPSEIYYAYTGAREYGAQTLSYVEEKDGLFANFYAGSAPGMPNFSKFMFDLSVAPTEQTLTGLSDVTGKILSFGEYGKYDVATGMKGSYVEEGMQGMTYLGNDFFYITTNNYNENMDTTVHLYKFVDGEFVSVK